MENYEIVQELGIGLQGSTFVVVLRETEQSFVLKKIECLDECEAKAAFHESLCFKEKVIHDCINPIVSVFVHWDKELSSMFLCIISEHHLVCDMMSFLVTQQNTNTPVEETQIVKWLAELVEVLTLVHSKKFFHCNLKPTNILLKLNGGILITDFTLPTVCSDLKQRTRTALGSRDYLAPEIPKRDHDSRSDIWSLGCIFLQLVTCSFSSPKQMIGQLSEVKHSPAALQDLLSQAKQFYSPELLTAITKMLSIDRGKRPDITGLAEDPFVASCLASLAAERDAKISGPCKPFSHGESTHMYLKYIVDNMVNRVCIRGIFEHLRKLAQMEQQVLVLDTSKKQVVIQALRQHSADAEIAEYGLQVLGSQVVTAFSEDYLFSFDSLSVVCALMKKHPTSVPVQRHSIFLLMASSVCDSGLEHMYNLRAVSLILAALRSFPDNVGLNISCLNALWSLILHGGSARILTEEKGVADVVSAIMRHKESREIFESGCALLLGISIEDQSIAAINKLGCVGEILDKILLHKRSVKAVRYACCALAAIVQADEESAYRLMSNAYGGHEVQGILRLVDIFNLHRGNSSLVASFLTLFLELAQYEDIASEMKHLKIGDLLFSTKKDYCDNLDILSLCDKVKTRIEGVRRLATIPKMAH